MTPTSLLLLATVGLLVGPLCSSLGARSRGIQAVVDGFALALILGLATVFVLPHAVEELGLVALGIAAVGVAFPLLIHRLGQGRSWSLGFIALALAAHVVLDGAVLSLRGDDSPVGWVVVAHRLPVGFALVVAAKAEHRSRRAVWALALSMVAVTVLGFALGPSLHAWVPESSTAAMDALVVGVLLHVVLPHGHEGHDDACAHDEDRRPHGDAHDHDHDHDHHHHDDHDHGAEPAPTRWWSAAGALAGLLAMAAGWVLGDTQALEGDIPTFLRTLFVLTLESAPALLIGYALAGVVPFLLTPTRTSALARGGSLRQSLRGVAFGLPLPVCSCGVLPLYASLIRRGAPVAAAMAFFVATPELGLDAVLLSVPLLGSSLTIARVVAAFAVALLVALIVGRTLETTEATAAEAPDPNAGTSWAVRIRSGLRFGFVDVFDHTMPWIALGLIIAATAEPLLSHGAIDQVPAFLQVPVAVLVGVPVYVCASGATPVAALALHKGLSAGAAIAFLIAGPATNMTTFGVLAKLHGRRTAVLFGVTVSVLAMVAGWTVDAIGISAAPVLDAHAHPGEHTSWIGWLSLGGLVALSVASLFRQGPRGAIRQIIEPIHAH